MNGDGIVIATVLLYARSGVLAVVLAEPLAELRNRDVIDEHPLREELIRSVRRMGYGVAVSGLLVLVVFLNGT